MIEILIFNVLAFALFTLMFFELVRKNDTSYVYMLILQFIGIAINFVELIIGKSLGIFTKIIMYTFSVILPLVIIWLEHKKNIELFQVLYLMLAKILISVGKNEKAIKYLEHVVEKSKNNKTANKLLAQVYEKLEKYELALEEYEKAYELDNEDNAILLKMGKLNNNLGRKEIAVKILSELLRKKPEYYEASIMLGDIYYYGGNYKEATMVYFSALKYKPNSYELNYYLGMSFTMLNDFNRAKEYYNKAANINSNLNHARFSIGQLELISGELESSELEFMKCINVEELEAEAYYYIARISMIKGEISKAQNYANIAIEEQPNLYYRMAEEDIFSPIIEKINRPQNTQERTSSKTITSREKQIDDHLQKTANLVGKLSNADITMISNMKKQRQEKEKDTGREEINL